MLLSRLRQVSSVYSIILVESLEMLNLEKFPLRMGKSG